jgi:hypothetical protein
LPLKKKVADKETYANETFTACMMSAALLALAGLALSQPVQQSLTLLISGHLGIAPVVLRKSRCYVETETLARIATDSLGPKENQTILTLPVSPPLVRAILLAKFATCPKVYRSTFFRSLRYRRGSSVLDPKPGEKL